MSLSVSLATGPVTPQLQEVTIGRVLRDAAAAVPDRVALIEGIPDASARRQWTYAEFDLQVDRVACALLNRYSPGDRIAVWAQNIPEWEFLEFGVARAGMVLVTINPGSQASELRYVLQQSRATAVFCVDSFRGNPMLATATRGPSRTARSCATSSGSPTWDDVPRIGRVVRWPTSPMSHRSTR